MGVRDAREWLAEVLTAAANRLQPSTAVDTPVDRAPTFDELARRRGSGVRWFEETEQERPVQEPCTGCGCMAPRTYAGLCPSCVLGETRR